MTQALVQPSQLLCGDRVIINKQIYSVNSMQGPDAHGVYDAYLQSENGATHKIISEPVTIIV
jgi:hypothetical protein